MPTGGGRRRLPAAFHGSDSGRSQKQKRRKDKGWGGGAGGEKGLLWDRVGRHETGQGRGGKDGQKGKVWTRRYALEREWGQRREAWRPDPTSLPMVRSDMEPLGLPFSHSTALKHPSHPITADARVPNRTGRAWWNWGQSEFEGTWWGPLGNGVSCRARTFVSPSEGHCKCTSIKRGSRGMSLFNLSSSAGRKFTMATGRWCTKNLSSRVSLLICSSLSHIGPLHRDVSNHPKIKRWK